MGIVVHIGEDNYTMDKRVLTQDKSILVASHIVVKEGCYPSRIVLRRGENDEFITHIEVLKGVPVPEKDSSGTGVAFVHHGFSNGKYFSFHQMTGRSEPEAWKEAMESFKERIQNL